MTKKEIRNIYKQKRLQLSDDKIMQFHERIVVQLRDFTLPDAKIILSYHPILSSNEINAKLIEKYIQFKNSTIQFVYPKLIDDKGNMEAVLEDINTDYQLLVK